MQTRELRQFAEARGWKIVGEYIDAGVRGAKDSRPELNRLMASVVSTLFVCGDSTGSPGLFPICYVRLKPSMPSGSTSSHSRSRRTRARLRGRWFSLS
jgi:hypothetical protein